MKTKIKKIVAFLGILLVIVLVYIFFIINIRKWIPTYENKVETFDNQEQIDKEDITNTHVEIHWKLFVGNGMSETLTDEQERQQLSNTVIQAIQAYAEKENLKGETQSDRRVTSLRERIPNSHYGNMVSLYYRETRKGRYEYKIIYSEDLKNISLTMYQYLQGSDYAQNYMAVEKEKEEDKEKEAEKKEQMIQTVTQAITEMKIPLDKPFQPVSIYLPEYQLPNLYLIEDEENHLSILFDANDKRIMTLTLGFVGIEEAIEEQNKLFQENEAASQAR